MNKPNSRNNSVSISISLVITILNESKTIELLLEALLKQTLQPKEIIIIDGGSSDSTLKQLKNFLKKTPVSFSKRFTIKTLKNSNRAQARNWGIEQVKTQLIAITDAGCVPQPSWLQKLAEKYQGALAPIVSGHYFGLPETPFEQAVVAYTLPPVEKINREKFLPTTRSVLLTKKVWRKLGKFDESLTTNEDFPFFYKAREQKVEIAFAKDALVGWLPRKTWGEFARMIFGFARGDIEAGIVRPKVQLLFGRYLLGFTALAGMLLLGVEVARIAAIAAIWLLIYLGWAIWKNAKYAPQGWYWLPLMQLVTDGCVMLGSVVGLVRVQARIQKKTCTNKQ